jgi:hypothetical protein
MLLWDLGFVLKRFERLEPFERLERVSCLTESPDPPSPKH